MNRRWTLRLFGIPILSIDVQCETEEVEQEDGWIEGGSCHDFERDTMPHDPNERYAPYDDRFGFA
ncbi:hypothetical protein PP713_14190 [Mycobacterium sp. CSUR Q5927]|nr:hypothetical protein [Mycobacterium sp. CSUR Q5927]